MRQVTSERNRFARSRVKNVSIDRQEAAPTTQVSETKRQLIFFWSYLEWGGAQIYLLAIMKQAKPDWNVKVILPKASSPDIVRFIKEVGVEYEFIDFFLDLGPAPTIRRKIVRQWRRIRSEILTFKHLMRYNLRDGILHIEAIPWQSWLLLTALRLRGANIFVTLHNAMSSESPVRRAIWKLRMKFVSRLRGFHIFASNQDTKEKLREWVEPDFWRSIRVTYTAVDPAEIDEVRSAPFDRDAMCKKHKLPSDKFLVLCVGQFIDRKGRWTFLDAAREISERETDIAFVWLTPVLPNEGDRKRIEEYGVDRSFSLILSEQVGSRREDILTFMRLADVFTLPSFVEGLPIALLEAMAIGAPCISTSVYAIPEAIKQRETGILIEPGYAGALARAILELKHNPALSNSLAKAGRRHVVETFDERKVAGIVLDSYSECFPETKRKSTTLSA